MTGVAIAAGVAALARGRVGRGAAVKRQSLTYSRAARCKDDSELIILDRVLPVFLRLHHRLFSRALEDALVT